MKHNWSTSLSSPGWPVYPQSCWQWSFHLCPPAWPLSSSRASCWRRVCASPVGHPAPGTLCPPSGPLAEPLSAAPCCTRPPWSATYAHGASPSESALEGRDSVSMWYQVIISTVLGFASYTTELLNYIRCWFVFQNSGSDKSTGCNSDQRLILMSLFYCIIVSIVTAHSQRLL